MTPVNPLTPSPRKEIVPGFKYLLLHGPLNIDECSFDSLARDSYSIISCIVPAFEAPDSIDFLRCELVRVQTESYPWSGVKIHFVMIRYTSMSSTIQTSR